MSVMEKGFWVAAGGLAGIVLGCMLFDDVELEPSHARRRLAKGNHTVFTEDDKIEAEHSVTAERFEASMDDESKADEQAQNLKAAMDRIGASLDETIKTLKTETPETTMA